MLEYPAAITSKWAAELEQAGLCCTGRETYDIILSIIFTVRN
jgi:hypothetical protein